MNLRTGSRSTIYILRLSGAVEKQWENGGEWTGDGAGKMERKWKRQDQPTLTDPMISRVIVKEQVCMYRVVEMKP